MKQKTAMQQLKEKLQDVINDLSDAKPGTDPYGYRGAMQNVVKDIDAQMLELEKKQIIEAFKEGDLDPTEYHKYDNAEQYYNQTFN